MARVLYVSYDGLLDPLGNSQILPYLIGLRTLGHQFTIVSFEKPARWNRGASELRKTLDRLGIRWAPCRFTAWPPLAAKAWDLLVLHRAVSAEWDAGAFDFIHCRGHVPVLAALPLARKSRAQYLFDVRGFWFDERVDSGLWDQGRLVYRMLYEYFKRREPEMYLKAGRLVTLTERARESLSTRFSELAAPNKVTVIPCCVDLDHFSRNAVTDSAARRMRRELNLTGAYPLVVYLGSIGTWYMLEEMLRFFALVRERAPQAKFLIVSPDSGEAVKRLGARLNIPSESLCCTELTRADVPTALSLADVGISFIKPCPSKQSSSPTKIGEMLSMGLPIVCNSGIGDLDSLFHDGSLGHLVEGFDPSSLQRAAEDVPRMLALDRSRIAQAAKKRFSLRAAIEQYDRIYAGFGRTTPLDSSQSESPKC